MIKVMSAIKLQLSDPGEYVVSLFADTKDEVVESATIEGMPENAIIGVGSNVLTASGDVAFRKSDDTWNWVGGE